MTLIIDIYKECLIYHNINPANLYAAQPPL